MVVNGLGQKMAIPFQPEKLCMLPRTGRVYHPANEKVGGAGILKTSLAIEFSNYFSYNSGASDDDPPSHFHWKGTDYELDNMLWDVLKSENVDEDEL